MRLIDDKDSVHEAALSRALSSIVIDAPENLGALSSSELIFCATDFSETFVPNGRNYITTSALFLPQSERVLWNHVYRKEFRNKDPFGNQSISYKDTNDRRLDHLGRLNRFIRQAGRISGLLVTASVPTSPRYIFTKKGDCKTHPKLEDFRDWKPTVFESLVRCAAVMAVAFRTFARDGQQIAWLCDADSILEGEDKQACTCHFVENWVNNHLELKLDFVVVRADSELLNDRAEAEDLLAIPDIAAGGVGDSIALFATKIGPERLGAWLPSPDGQKTKANEVILWMGDRNLPLVRAAISLEPSIRQAVAHQFGQEPK